MSTVDRRTLLALGAGAAATAAFGRFPHAFGAPPAPRDRSDSAPSLPVGIDRCATYDRAMVTASMSKLFDQIGGVKKLVKGKTVTIKPNITAGPGFPCLGLPPEITF